MPVTDPFFYLVAIPAVLLLMDLLGTLVRMLSFKLLDERLVAGIVGIFTLLFLAQRLLFPPKARQPASAEVAWRGADHGFGLHQLLDRRNMATSLALLPFAPIGVLAGVRLAHRIQLRLFYRLAYAGMFFTGCKLVRDGFSSRV